MTFQTTHGMSRSPEHNAWARMIQRCENPNEGGYKNYGGRGIRVCAEWRASFSAFLRDMGRRPSGIHSIDRIDVDGDYAPGNCRWATPSEQSRNRRVNKLTEQKADLIRRRVSAGERKADVARSMGVSWTTVHAVVIGLRWADEAACRALAKKAGI